MFHLMYYTKEMQQKSHLKKLDHDYLMDNPTKTALRVMFGLDKYIANYSEQS